MNLPAYFIGAALGQLLLHFVLVPLGRRLVTWWRRDPLADTCRLCLKPFGGTRVGFGDGTGERFVHVDCYEMYRFIQRRSAL